MKTFFRIIASLMALLGMAACQQFEIDTQITPEKAAANIRLVCDALSTYEVAALNPDDISFTITANTPWAITRSGGEDWCSVSPTSSSASALVSDITVKMDSNPGLEERSITLTIKGDNVPVAKTITITQGKNTSLYVTPIAQEYAAVGGPLNFSINTNVAWEVRSNASWLSFNRTSGNPDPEGRAITIVATAAASSVMERVATITVIAGDEQESFDVAQRGSFELAGIFDAFPGAGGSQAFFLRTDLPWEVNCDQTWLSFDQTEGTGEGKNIKITATATPNESNNRKATVSVKAGGAVKSFEVLQKGVNFELVAPASTEISRVGGSLVVEVNTDMEWSVECSVADWAVEKTDASHIKVTLPWNNKFATVEGTLTLKGPGGLTDELTLTQPCNFTLDGHYELLPDGSVKIYNDVPTRVTAIDQYRFLQMILTLGDVSFVDNGRLWVVTKAGDCNIYNQVTVGGTVRLRTDGTLKDGSTSTYNNAKYSLSKDEMNKMSKYQFNILPDPADATKHITQFFYNDEESPRATLNSVSGIMDLPAESFSYWFGVASEDLVANDSWYVVKSCDIIPVEG